MAGTGFPLEWEGAFAGAGAAAFAPPFPSNKLFKDVASFDARAAATLACALPALAPVLAGGAFGAAFVELLDKDFEDIDPFLVGLTHFGVPRF